MEQGTLYMWGIYLIYIFPDLSVDIFDYEVDIFGV